MCILGTVLEKQLGRRLGRSYWDRKFNKDFLKGPRFKLLHCMSEAGGGGRTFQKEDTPWAKPSDLTIVCSSLGQRMQAGVDQKGWWQVGDEPPESRIKHLEAACL